MSPQDPTTRSRLASCLPSNHRPQLLQWFLDYPGERCLFSIHNMIQLGQQYDQLPGEWFGPTTASLVMRDLAVVQQHCLDGSLCVHVAPSDVVYIDDIESICGPLKGEAAESGGADEGGVASGGGGDGGEGGEGGEGGDEANAGGAGARGSVDAHSEGTEEAKGADRAAPANVAADVAAVAEAGTGEAGTAPATAGASLLPPATATDPLAAADPLSAGGEFLDPLLNSSTPEEAAKAAGTTPNPNRAPNLAPTRPDPTRPDPTRPDPTWRNRPDPTRLGPN